MNSFFLGISLFLCLMILPCLYRAIVGPTVIDRMVAVGAIGTKTLVILILMGFLYERVAMFIDISMFYAILNFLGTLAAVRYFEMEGDI